MNSQFAYNQLFIKSTLLFYLISLILCYILPSVKKHVRCLRM